MWHKNRFKIRKPSKNNLKGQDWNFKWLLFPQLVINCRCLKTGYCRCPLAMSTSQITISKLYQGWKYLLPKQSSNFSLGLRNTKQSRQKLFCHKQIYVFYIPHVFHTHGKIISETMLISNRKEVFRYAAIANVIVLDRLVQKSLWMRPLNRKRRF